MGVLPRAERFEDAVAALTRLGYTAPQAQDAVRRVAEAGEELSLEDLVRRALALLGKAAAQTYERAGRGR
jgi:Holliday junction resolvasome RuvABC DNA-binding subunit